MKKLLTTYCTALALLCPALLWAQIPVAINSGDPAFPFPQFLPYVHPSGDTLHNLGTRNPDGVVHAEMEKTVRDAYQIMMNRADYTALNGVTRVGGGTNGTRYIEFHSNPRCSEGDGYAMLAAAMMADKVTFDGLWLHVHDFSMNKVTRYGDGGQNTPNYNYAPLPGVYGGAGDNSAADGDFDIALALMIAHMQWGEFMGINDSRGNPISYKADYLKIIRAMTDTLANRETLPERELLTGNIGFDGYIRGGNTWGEFTRWAASAANLQTIGINANRVYQPNGDQQHIDYAAPAYFRQFADYLNREDSARYAWNISQYRRGEASSDWLMGKLIEQNPRHIPVVGWVNMPTGTNPVFSNFTDGEDFRAAWRTVLNYVWHGNPAYSWDPARHSVIRNTANTHERDVGLRFARFLWDRRQTPWSITNETIIGTGGANWWGPSILKYYYTPTGVEQSTFPLNWLHGTGSPSAVTAQDFDLMPEMYRQCELEMDVESGTGYLDRKPVYFHGFFRLLGMMVLTGNHHAPLEMKRQANMKVYLDVDRTYVFEGDTITYTIEYRNYGAGDASGVVITNRLHNDMVYVSSSGGGTYDMSSNTVRWNVGSVPGYKSSMGANPAQTKGTMTLKVFIPFANLKRYENSVEITCSNGPGWVSNEFPNKISSVMKRNGVDIARRALRGEFSVYRDTVNPGAEVTYTLTFENSTEAGWLNGGRPGVNFSYMHKGTAASASDHTFMMRIFHDAHEAYIDYGNYRISYFMFDNNNTALASPPTAMAPGRWTINTDIMADPALTPFVTPKHEIIPAGQDSRGRWNQRLIVQVADPETRAADTNWISMAATSQHLITYYGDARRIARGGSAPYKAVWRMTANYVNREWGADWSYNSRASGDTGNDDIANWGFPVTPDFTGSYDPDYTGVPVTRLHRKLTNAPPSRQVDNVLIEEWDGYTWRRVFGNGPVPGREVTNVVIRDTLPPGVTFLGFVGPNPLGVAPTVTGGRFIEWKIGKMLTGESGKIEMLVRVDTVPRAGSSVRLTSRAWLSADRESGFMRSAVLVVTNDVLPCQPPPRTTLVKTADRDTYFAGDTVSYTIGYRQAHGTSVASSSASQWSGSAVNVSSNGRTISMGNNTNMYFTQSNGRDMTITGTIDFVPYAEPIVIFGRNSSGSSTNTSVDITFRQQWAGIEITVRSNGTAVNTAPFTVQVPNSPITMDFKLVFEGGELRLWLGDTDALIPHEVFTVASQAGYAGVRYSPPGQNVNEGMSIKDWTVHTSSVFDVTIRDIIPEGVTYISGSASGRINTGALASTALTGTASGGVITWPVVTGNTSLGRDDSLTVTWRGIVGDAVPHNTIVNNVYADISGYAANSIAAQACSRFSTQPPPPPPPPGKLGIAADPAGGSFVGSVTVTLSSVPAGAKIYYTLDGSAPNPDGPIGAVTREYTPGRPLVFTTTTTLSAVARDPDGELDPSDVLVYTYEIEEPPRNPDQLGLSANPASCMFSGSIEVTLSSQPPGAAIYYTRNGMNPDDPNTPPNTIFTYTPGEPLVFTATTTLSAVARDPKGELEPSNVIVHTYELMRTVPVQSAVFFDDVGDGLAHGVMLILSPSRTQEPNTGAIESHYRELLKFTGMTFPEIDNIRFSGDTVRLYFRGAGVEPSSSAQLEIREPDFSTGAYPSVHGYLAARTLAIIDGVAPIATGAVYYPSLAEGKASPVAGDTLAVTFNKYAKFANMTGVTVPFTLSYSGGTYELSLEYVRHDRNTVYFIVRGVGGENPVEVPSEGDMLRIKPDGEVLNFDSYAQFNENNPAVPLRISYPELDYIVKMGPSPFRAASDNPMRIWIRIEPYLPAVFEGLNPSVKIYDKLGNIVAASGENMEVEREGMRYVISWKGANRKGRIAGTGTYVAIITMKDQNGNTRTIRQKLYVLNR